MNGEGGIVRTLREQIAIFLVLVTCVWGGGGCARASQAPADTPPATATDATAIAAQSIVDSALRASATPATLPLDVTPAPIATLTPTSTTARSPTATRPPTATTSPTSTPDAAATGQALAAAVASALAATQAAWPTATPDHVATVTAQAHAIETAIAATLTARPTLTPNLAATRAAQTALLETAVAATLTAQPRPTATHTATPTLAPTVARSRELVIGASVNERPIEVVEIGSGERKIIFVGGLHAGSAPSTAALARQVADYFRSRPEGVPSSVTLGIVLNANPDAVRAPGKLEGRLNAAGVDLNRNWDCEWQAQAKWRDHTVSGGGAPFSEMETQALLNYITDGGAVAVIFWEAKMETGQVSAGGCGERSLVSQPLAEIYGGATGYTVDPWAWYPVNGDAANSLDIRGIPAASVLLRDYENTDWPLNLRGILAVMDAYAR